MRKIELHAETLSYQTRPAKRETCTHPVMCKGEEREHRAVYDPHEKAWVEICMFCGTTEFSDDELEKRPEKLKNAQKAGIYKGKKKP